MVRAHAQGHEEQVWADAQVHPSYRRAQKDVGCRALSLQPFQGLKHVHDKPHGPSPAVSRPCACWSDHQLAPWAHLKTPTAEREMGRRGMGRDTKGAQPAERLLRRDQKAQSRG